MLLRSIRSLCQFENALISVFLTTKRHVLKALSESYISLHRLYIEICPVISISREFSIWNLDLSCFSFQHFKFRGEKGGGTHPEGKGEELKCKQRVTYISPWLWCFLFNILQMLYTEKWRKVSLPILKFTVDSALFLSALVKDAASLLTKTTSSIMTDSTCSTYKYSLWLRTMAGWLINISSNASSVPCANLFLNKKSHLLLHSHLIKMQRTSSKAPESHCAPSSDTGHRFQTVFLLAGIRNRGKN